MFEWTSHLSPEAVRGMASDILAVVSAGTAFVTVLIARAAMHSQASVSVAENRSWIDWGGHTVNPSAVPDESVVVFDVCADGPTAARNLRIVLVAHLLQNGKRMRVSTVVWMDKLHIDKVDLEIVLPLAWPVAAGNGCEIDLAMSASYSDFAISRRRQTLAVKINSTAGLPAGPYHLSYWKQVWFFRRMTGRQR